MKFELQIPENRIYRVDRRGDVEALPRKFGPEDLLHRGASGVRLESETRGQLEFETSWHRRWSAIRRNLEEAAAMTQAMNDADDFHGPTRWVGDEGRPPQGNKKVFPLPDAHLRTGTKKEMRKGRWLRETPRSKPFERNKGERILGPNDWLMVDISDDAWQAAIQTSESFELQQYESFFREHEYPHYEAIGTAAVDAIMAQAVTPERQLGNLRNLLLIIVNYVQRGQGGPTARKTQTFEHVRGMPSKQAFLLLSRTDFGSMYKTLLTKREQREFRRLVAQNVIVDVLGVQPTTPVFVKGYGKDPHRPGPTVQQWLVGITKERDLLSSRRGQGFSRAQGRFTVDRRRGRKHSRLVRFEARGSRSGIRATATDWVKFARERFRSAKRSRKRTGSTQLVP